MTIVSVGDIRQFAIMHSGTGRPYVMATSGFQQQIDWVEVD